MISIIFAIAVSTDTINAETSLSNIKLSGHYVGEKGVVYYVHNKAVILPVGIEAIMDLTDIHDEESLPVDTVDIETYFRMKSEFSGKAMLATLKIYAKTVPFIFRQDVPRELIFDITQMAHDAKWESHPLLSRSTQPVQEDVATATILFRKVNLRNLIDAYINKKIWPVELKFTISLQVSGEDAGAIAKNLRIPIPPY